MCRLLQILFGALTPCLRLTNTKLCIIKTIMCYNNLPCGFSYARFKAVV